MQARASIFILFFLGLALGARVWWVYAQPPVSFGASLNAMAVVEGVVVADADVRATATRITLEVATLNGKAAEGKVLAVLPKEGEVEFGDRVVVRGMLEEPKSFITQSGREFDYQNYLRVRGIWGIVSRAALLEREAGPWSIQKALFSIKHSFEHALERVLTEPHVSLLEGILLGERGGFPLALLQAFALVGLIHIVVLSGSNLSIVAEAVFRALAFLPRGATFVLGGVLMLLFVLMTGGGAASIRALIMASLALLARFVRRPEAALRGLFFAAAAMVAWSPLLLRDSGFVLSVLATFGLITLSPFFETKLSRIPAWPRFNLRSLVASTIAVEAFLLPALLYYAGTFSLVSLPVNVLVLPLVPVIMLAGFIAGTLALVAPSLALLPALISDLLLRLVIAVAEFGATLPLGATLATFPWWLAVLLYLPFVALAMRLHVRSESRVPAN